MPIDELIKAAEKYIEEEQKTAKKKPSTPPQKTLFDSRQFER